MKTQKTLQYAAFAAAMALSGLAQANSVSGDHWLSLDVSNLFDQDVEHSVQHQSGSSFTETFGLQITGQPVSTHMVINADAGQVGTAKFNFSSFNLLDAASNLLVTGSLVNDGLGNFTQATLSTQNLVAGNYAIQVSGTTLSTGKYDVNVNSAVPVPAAVWLFGSALATLSMKRAKREERSHVALG